MLFMACVCLLVAGLKDKEGVEEFSKSRHAHYAKALLHVPSQYLVHLHWTYMKLHQKTANYSPPQKIASNQYPEAS